MPSYIHHLNNSRKRLDLREIRAKMDLTIEKHCPAFWKGGSLLEKSTMSFKEITRETVSWLMIKDYSCDTSNLV